MNKKINNTIQGFFLEFFLLLTYNWMITPGLAVIPHPIYGIAIWKGDGYATGAFVTVTSPIGSLTTTVDSNGSWQVDCGDPGPNWPNGTVFYVTITGYDIHGEWSVSTTGTVSGYFNNIGNLILHTNTTYQGNTNQTDTSTGDNNQQENNLNTDNTHGFVTMLLLVSLVVVLFLLLVFLYRKYH